MFPSLLRRMGWICTAFGFAAAVGLGGTTSAQAQGLAGHIEAIDLPLPSLPWLVRPAEWHGKPAVMVFTRGEDPVPGAPVGPRLMLFGVRETGWVHLGEWGVPSGLRWVEPMRLPGGETGWLALVGSEVQIGRTTASGLNWSVLCACASLYTNANPEELGTRLAIDLDGDGVDEVVLPTSRGLAIYRVLLTGTDTSGPIGLDPIALELWQADGTELPSGPPPELFPWPTKEGILLLRLRGDTLMTQRLANRGRSIPMEVDSLARARLQNAKIPDPLRGAIAKISDGQYTGAPALLAALGQRAGPAALEQAAPFLATILTALRGGWEETPPDLAKLPGVVQGPEDRGYLLALEDVTGDGIPDLLHGLARNEKQILKVESELRFFPGTSARPLAFGTPKTIKAEGLAVGAVLRAGPARYVLVVARAEVSVGALFRAKLTRQLDVETSIYSLGPQGLDTQPERRATLTFKGFEEDSQVIALTADLTGNGLTALLLNLEPDLINIYFPQADSLNLGRPTAHVNGPLPRKREEALVADFQGNGRESILFWYRGRTMSETQRRTLRLIRWVPEAK